MRDENQSDHGSKKREQKERPTSSLSSFDV